MTTRRRLMLFGLLAGLLALGAGGWLLWPRTSAITRENAAKIKAGMSLAEVEAILGGPARGGERKLQIDLDPDPIQGDGLRCLSCSAAPRESCRHALAMAAPLAAKSFQPGANRFKCPIRIKAERG